MELIPENQRYDILASSALHNLEESGVDVIPPNRVSFGYTPRGAACMDETADTVFVGSEIIAGSDKEDLLIDLEHEFIHATQFQHIFGETPENYHEARREIERRALENGLKVFDDEEYMESFMANGNVHRGNLPLMLAMASGEERFIEPVERAYRGRRRTLERKQERFERLESELLSPDIQTVPEIEEELELSEFRELSDAHRQMISAEFSPETDFRREAEEEVNDYWDELRNSEATDFAEPVIQRYTPRNDFRDDMVEAQPQFWSFFRRHLLKDVEDHASGVYPEPLEEALESIDRSYSTDQWYSHGDNVRNELEFRIELYRDRLSEGEDPYEAAVGVVNQDYQRWAS